MTPMTEVQIRACFANASRREASQATLPDLEAMDWGRLDYLGWRDRKAPLLAYAVVEVAGDLVGLLLRSTERRADAPRRRTICTWCEDVINTDDVTLYVARRGGAAGKRDDTLGTLICTDFRCSANVRRRPTSAEAGSNVEEVRELFIETRIAGLRERSARFAAEVRRTR